MGLPWKMVVLRITIIISYYPFRKYDENDVCNQTHIRLVNNRVLEEDTDNRKDGGDETVSHLRQIRCESSWLVGWPPRSCLLGPPYQAAGGGAVCSGRLALS